MFVLFQVLIPILLLNMLIAMMGNTYAIVNEKSDKEFLKQVLYQIYYRVNIFLLAFIIFPFFITNRYFLQTKRFWDTRVCFPYVCLCLMLNQKTLDEMSIDIVRA